MVDGINKVVNLMKDLMRLAEEHRIEEKLYHGDAMDKIHSLMGQEKFRKWLDLSCEKSLSTEKDQWNELIKFLEKEIKICQQEIIWFAKTKKKQQTPKDNPPPPLPPRNRSNHVHNNNGGNSSACFICGANDHVSTQGPNGTRLIQYFVCPKFVEMTNKERFVLLKAKNLCVQCLYPGASSDRGKHKEGKCQRDFICKHVSHNRHPAKKHVLICDEHKEENQNKATFEEYKRRCILRPNQVDLPSHARNILIHHSYPSSNEDSSSDEGETAVNSTPTSKAILSVELASSAAAASSDSPPIVTTPGLETQGTSGDMGRPLQLAGGDSHTGLELKGASIHACKVIDDVHEDAIYVLQKIKVDGQIYNLFYDNGCKRFCSRHEAIKRLGKRATLLEAGPMTLGGVGGMRMQTPHGRYGVRLPIRGGDEVLLSGMCLDIITETFPTYPLLGQVTDDIKAAYRAKGGHVRDLPVLEPSVGGDTDLMIGIPYMKVFPEQVFKMDCGLTIYRSYFQNASGGYGVVGGSHQVFTEIENQHHLRTANFISSQLKIYNTGYQVNPDVRLLGYQSTYTDKFNHYIEDSAVTDAVPVGDAAMLQKYVDNHPSVAPRSSVYDDDIVGSIDIDSVSSLNDDLVVATVKKDSAAPVDNDLVMSVDNDSVDYDFVASVAHDSVISVTKDAAASVNCDSAVFVDGDVVMSDNNDSVSCLKNDITVNSDSPVVSVKNRPVMSVMTALERLIGSTIQQDDVNVDTNSANPKDSSAAYVNSLTSNTVQHLLNADVTHNVNCSQNTDNLNTDTSDLTDDDILAGFADYDMYYVEDTEDTCNNCYLNSTAFKVARAVLRKFQESQDVGSEIQYRCIKCRACQDCKNCEECLSIREEIEQDLIVRSVRIDPENHVVTVSLPVMADPSVKLCPNKDIARKVYDRQLKKLKNNEKDRASVIESEKKLHDLGYVAYLKDLPEDQQKYLKDHPVQNFIPWLVVYKASSQTTPCRLVFDASMPTASGVSLNDILPKGANNLNKMLEIFLRWRVKRFAYHNDINKMYNGLQLIPTDWCLQRYLFEPTLDPNKEPLEGVIMTAIYGVKPSGNQAGVALRKLAETFKSDYPEIHEVIKKDLYVDDCMSGEQSVEQMTKMMNNLEFVLNTVGWTLKSYTVSGEHPHESLTRDGVSIDVAGHKWFSQEDAISLYIKELNFAKKKRGRQVDAVKEIPEKLTRKMCHSKVAEVFDMCGLLTPITAPWKVDLRQFVQRQLKWEGAIPDNLRPLWESNFAMIGQLKELRYKRAIVPDDAASLEIETLEFGDASQSLVCVAIYVRFLRKCGSYSCQLLLGKSRLVPEGMSQPRAEMYAAVVNTHSGEIVRRALAKYHKQSVKFTDSQIVLHWIHNDSRVHKQWLRNRQIEVLRFTLAAWWLYVKSADMIADIGTRRGAQLKDVDQDSNWINGFEWMKGDLSDFPTKTVDEIKLSASEALEAAKEVIPLIEVNMTDSERDYVYDRYRFSDYIIDPNLHSFQQVKRLLAIVIRYTQVLRQRVEVKRSGGTPVAIPSNSEIFIPEESYRAAELYYAKKATEEVKHFYKSQKYGPVSKEVDGVLYYTGRILPSDEVTIVGRATEVMKDLSSTTFCVPITDRYSPIAFSLVNDIHWHDKCAHHSGVETTWRYVLKHMFILEGRSLVKSIGNDCQRCRYLLKKALAVPMGPISEHNVTIAPAFYVCQLDLVGPFLAYSYHHKRTTIKIWLIVFCCATTSATKIKVMEDYSTTAFIQAFTRFACDVGYPKRVLADGGGQLVKGCESMLLNFEDLKSRLHRDAKVDLDVCPVGGHNMHGKVERRIRHVRESLMKSLGNERLGLLQWETIAASIANSINNLPLALGNIKGDYEFADLITPNRLLLGRNNDRSPTEPVTLAKDYDKIIRSNNQIYDAWFETWLISHVPKLMNHPKWYKADRDLCEGDVVLFLKQESEICSDYKYGMVESVELGRDGRIRKVRVRYRNSNEKVDRFTYRSTRSLVVIHPVEEVSIMQELGEIAVKVDAERNAQL